jgi:hypothetical protein
VLTWPDAGPGANYNLYRKMDPTVAWPATPLNGNQPISPVTDPAKLQALLHPWGGPDLCNIINHALATPNPNDPSGPPTPFNCANLGSVVRGSAQWNQLQDLARGKWQIAVAIGQGYTDTSVNVGQTYYYELRWLDANGAPQASDVTVVAGAASPIPPPPNLQAAAGDSRVLLTWGIPPAAPGSPPPAGYYVYRSEAGGPFLIINESGLTTQIKFDLQGNPVPVSNGLMDAQNWADSGLPIPHWERGVPINGPHNGVQYMYQVRAMDLLGNASKLATAPVGPFTPQDTTPPQAPGGVSVSVNDATATMTITWNLVGTDASGHPEWVYNPQNPNGPVLSGVVKYRVYRFPNGSDPNNGVPVRELQRPQVLGGKAVGTMSCNEVLVRPQYGEASVWYRVECEDAARNVSQWSGAVNGILHDITPPAVPKNLAAQGLQDRIVVTWDLNTEPDMDGYLIFRNICHASTNTAWIQVGYLSQYDAMTQHQQGTGPRFEDVTVPANSPLCYAYLVKAMDLSQNKSGDWPILQPPVQDPSACARLQDRTPPPPAVITTLQSLDSAVNISWVAAPVQDILAYLVYRSETENGPYDFVIGRTVERDPAGNPKTGTVLHPPLQLPSPTGCDTIFPQVIRELGTGTLSDATVQAKKIYWYKVVGVDQSGNVSDINSAVPVSTFTFSTQGPAAPAIVSATPSASPCQVALAWKPAFDASSQSGFLVLRSTAPGTNPFRQIGGLVTGASQYTDTQVQRGITYWYQVVTLDAHGLPSAASPAVHVMP